MTTPRLGVSVAMGARAAAREGWLLPVAGVVALARTLATVPALAFGLAALLEGSALAAHLRPGQVTAPLEGGAALLTSPRYLSIVAGLWLAGTLLSATLRGLFLAGALPTLGARLAGVDATRRFAAGAAWGFGRQLGTALLSALVELGATGYLIALLVAAARLAEATDRPLPPFSLALVGALGITVGVAGLVASRVLGDAAAARTAILGEGPATAVAGAFARLAARPGAFLLGGLGLGLVTLAARGAFQPVSALLSAAAPGAAPLVLLGPQLMLALASLLAAAGVDLAWLSTVATLACGQERQEARPRTFSA